MKKSAIKMIAGVSALAIFSSISATTIPAFAEEYDAIQEQDYVATFADEQTQNVANYLLENGVSMEEAQEMMEHYVNGRAMIEQRENAENGISLLSDEAKVFYNGQNFTSYKNSLKSKNSDIKFKKEQHYGAFVIEDPKIEAYVTSRVMWDKNSAGQLITPKSTFYIFNGYDTNTSFSIASKGESASFTTDVEKKDVDHVLVMATFPFSAQSRLNSEAAIKNAIVNKNFVTLIDGNADSSTFDFHTFVLGDFNHDGVVCDDDYADLMDFIMCTFDGYYDYTNENPRTAFEINTTAVDLNMDGVLDIRDAIAWNKLS